MIDFLKYKLIPIAIFLIGIIMLFLKYNFTLSFIQYGINILLLSLITLVDLKEFRIPNKLILYLLCTNILFIIVSIFFDTNTLFLEYILCFFCGGILFFIIAIITKGAIGGGDIKLFASLGLLFNIETYFLMIMITFLLSGLYCVICYLRAKINKDTSIPMASFISISTLITLLCGKEILLNYQNFLINLFFK